MGEEVEVVVVAGREGDWECGSCANRNYAFRSLCNRCKQPRLLVDTKTPADSKWLPRIGDWICNGCSNNNYASRDKCKKCGQPKELAAAAFPIPGGPPTYTSAAHYFAKAPMHHSLPPPNSTWPPPPPPGEGGAAADIYGHQLRYNWPSGGSSISGPSYLNNAAPLPVVPNGWRSGDWICNCGFHNYSSRAECKKCNVSFPSGTASSEANMGLFQSHGTKRLASEEFFGELDNKRLNAGDINNHFLAHQPHSYQGYGQIWHPSNDQTSGLYPYPCGSSATSLNPQVNMHLPQLAPVPTLLGKGAKQWRDGDWMCTNCSNHNYASRSQCNRCKNEKDATNQSVGVA